MADQFPNLKPSDRQFKLGSYPTKTYRALSGATVKRSFGNRPTGYELQLRYTNISDDITVQLLDHYTSTSGGFERFTLPAALFAGMSSDLASRVQSPTGIKWEYAGAPEVESVFTGISAVTINLIGEQDF
jgi:hypothetical protein